MTQHSLFTLREILLFFALLGFIVAMVFYGPVPVEMQTTRLVEIER